MKRRLIAAFAALLLAGVSAVVLVKYVSGADQRAMAGMQTTTVYVVTAAVPVGTTAAGLGASVATRTLPRSAVVSGAVTSLTEIAGKVATTDLQPGEQLLSSRFADPATAAASHKASVPKGFHRVSIQLDPPQVVGGDLAAGDHVGVFITNTDDKTTHLTVPRALVTRTQGAISRPPGTTSPGGSSTDNAASKQPSSDSSASADAIPDGSVIVTVAVSAADAEKIVWGAENGKIWLSLENAQSTQNGTTIITGKKVFQ